MDNFPQYSIEWYQYNVSVVDFPLLFLDMPVATIVLKKEKKNGRKKIIYKIFFIIKLIKLIRKFQYITSQKNFYLKLD